MSVFNKVMDAFYKQSAKRIKHKEVKRERYRQVYGNIEGSKKTCDELKEIFDSGGIIIDLRNPVDFISGGMVHNAINVPAKDIDNWLNSNNNLTKNTPIMLYSTNGITAIEVLEKLKRTPYNFNNVHNIGAARWYPNCSC